MLKEKNWRFALTGLFVALAVSLSGVSLAQTAAGAAGKQQGQPGWAIKNKAEFDYVKKKAEAGDAQSQYRLSIAYSDGKFVKADDRIMVEWLKKAAAQNHTEAQFYLSSMYAKGIGVQKDYAQAAFWMRKVADKGVDMAQYNLGTMYEMGAGVPKNQQQAMEWYRKSAAQGNPYAKKRLEEIKKNGPKQSGIPAR